MRSDRLDFGFERPNVEGLVWGLRGLIQALGGLVFGFHGGTDGRKLQKIALSGIKGPRPFQGRCPKQKLKERRKTDSRKERKKDIKKE